MADSVGANKIIFSKFSDTVTHERKTAAWARITKSVNAVSQVKRDVQEIRRKWTDWSGVTKQKEQKRRHALKQTGGGGKQVTDLTAAENTVVALLGETAIMGVAQCVDSAAPPQRQTEKAGGNMEEDYGSEDGSKSLTEDEDSVGPSETERNTTTSFRPTAAPVDRETSQSQRSSFVSLLEKFLAAKALDMSRRKHM